MAKTERGNVPPARAVIPVVGLGGSAGALASLEAFFGAMPADSGAAFVVVQHMSPAGKSLLPELLAKHTPMPVAEAHDRARIQANCVYVIPPNQQVGVEGGVLFLAGPPSDPAVPMPVDYFFRRLADDLEQSAIGVVLSGTGSDGTLGARAIRASGGLVIAEDPQNARFGDMPRRTIGAGLADHILAAEHMPRAILHYLRHPYAGARRAAAPAQANPAVVHDILALIRGHTGADFRNYKPPTILRRIGRRMGLRQVRDMAEYLALLRREPNEVKRLFKDLLINVTEFFRDPEAFDELRDLALAPLLQGRARQEPLRMWVPACATGEEAYSLAILASEQLAKAASECPLQLFATDLDDEALEVARAAHYPESITADVSAQRLKDFFVRKDGGYRIKETLRETLTFATHNILSDPPFSKMDIISCRNLLIYLDGDAQARLMALFNFALKPNGCLLLGRSETVAGQNDLFETISKKSRLCRRLVPARPLLLDSSIMPGRRRLVRPVPVPTGTLPSNFADVVRVEMLRHFGASALLVDRKGKVLQFHGQTGWYLNLPAPGPNFNAFELAKDRLAPKLRLALHKAIADDQPVVLESVAFMRDEKTAFARITVVPVAARAPAQLLLVVFFEDVSGPPALAAEVLPIPGEDVVIQRLEGELRAAQQDLQATIGELQSSNEELRVANEEVSSTNEELESTNEELTTSTEELQSTNEELTATINQLQEKVDLLDRANSDVANFLKSSQIATLFLDSELRIKFCTPAMKRILGVTTPDIGRAIDQVSPALTGCDLLADLRTVVRDSSLIEREVSHQDGACYVMRVMPYYTRADRADGVVVTFADISSLRRSEQRFHTLVESSPNALLLVGADGAIMLLNRRAEAMFRYTREQLIGRAVEVLVPKHSRKAHRSQRNQFIAHPQERPMGAGRDLLAMRRDGTTFPAEIGLTPLDMPEGMVTLATITDITERKRLAHGASRR